MVDPYDIEWRSLSYGELCMIVDLAEGEIKRRNFPGSDADRLMSADKKVASIAFQLRIASQSLRTICRDLKERRDKGKEA